MSDSRSDLGGQRGEARCQRITNTERYIQTVHLVSNIVGTSMTRLQRYDSSMFPWWYDYCRPKVRCMEIIERINRCKA